MLKGLHPERDTLHFERQESRGIDTATNFRYYNRVKILLETYDFAFPTDSTIQLPITIVNPTQQPVRFDQNPQMPVKLEYCLFWYGKKLNCQTVINQWPLKKLDPGEIFKTSILFNTPAEPGDHFRFRLAIRSGLSEGIISLVT